MSLIKPSNKKSLQNLIIFIILIAINIAILILSFFIGQINSIELLTTVTPTMVAMIALLNVMFIGCRIALEIIFVEK
jgi:membrane protein YdbS with pleckstrin-like domain